MHVCRRPAFFQCSAIIRITAPKGQHAAQRHVLAYTSFVSLFLQLTGCSNRMAYESDYSDLTDLDDDYEIAPSTSRKKAPTKGAAKGAYRIKNALKPPRATTYTAQALYGADDMISLLSIS